MTTWQTESTPRYCIRKKPLLIWKVHLQPELKWGWIRGIKKRELQGSLDGHQCSSHTEQCIPASFKYASPYTRWASRWHNWWLYLPQNLLIETSDKDSNSLSLCSLYMCCFREKSPANFLNGKRNIVFAQILSLKFLLGLSFFCFLGDFF